MLRDRAGMEPACARIARLLGAADAAEYGGSEGAPPPHDADEQDAAFWRRFESQTAAAAQQLPNAGAQVALDVHARNVPMDVNAFMKAASIVPQWAMHVEGKATAAASPSGCGRGESASVSPTTVDAAWHWGASIADGNCSSCSGGPDGKAADAKKRKGSSPAPGKRRRRTASKKSAAFQSPPSKSSSSRAAFLSPGQEAARNLLALRHGVS
jgi:hypothetical protein